jgi:PEP-CTERM motif-containing protein
MRLSRSRSLLLSLAAVLAAPSSAMATLIMEPVFNRVAGTGPGGNVLGFYIPELINPATGEPILIADEPGEVDTFPAGFPADPVLVNTVRFYNNTSYDLTGFSLSLVGTADEPTPFNFTVTRDANVDAFWGDVDGDGFVGHSDIFGSITLSADHRTIFFSDGVIPVGGRFTDFNLAMTSDGEPFKAAVDATFSGTPVPEPATMTLLTTGVGLLATAIRQRRRPKL